MCCVYNYILNKENSKLIAVQGSCHPSLCVLVIVTITYEIFQNAYIM